MAATPPALNLPGLLSADRALLERFLNTLGDALFVVDARNRVVYWNLQAEKLTGFKAEEVLGQHCLAAIRCENCLSQCNLFERGAIADAKVTIATKGGRRLNVSKNAFVLADAEGRTIGGVELLRDETALFEQMEACRQEREKVEARERLQAAILGSIREGVLSIDRDWRITAFSRRAEAVTGWRAEEAIGRFCHEVIGSELCKNGCPALHCLETGDEEAERTTTMTAADGSPLPATEIAVPLRDETGAAIGSLLIVEDRRRLAADIAEGSAHFAGMIGASKAMRQVFRVVAQVAPTEATVLVGGESGTGKERVARALHALSKRRTGPFEAVNCAALPETLLESELFGHVKGAFTGAVRDQLGRIERAEGGTLFLDEIGDLKPALQAKLLRFLQEKEYQRVGEGKTRQADVRLVAATNRDLAAAVKSGEFREDLFYRLNVIPIILPPLRERMEDVPLLAANLLNALAKERGRPELSLTPAGLGRLMHHSWPGNVRELINVLEYAIALAPGRRIGPGDLPPTLSDAPVRYSRPEEGDDGEARRIADALAAHRGNRSRAARALGMNRVTLYRKLKRYRLE